MRSWYPQRGGSQETAQGNVVRRRFLGLRLVNTSYSIVPEAPRLIGDLVGTYQKLPFRLQAKGEFEYVGRKVVGNGCGETAYLSGDTNALNYFASASRTRSCAWRWCGRSSKGG